MNKHNERAELKPLTEVRARNLCICGPVYAPDGVVTRSPSEYRRDIEDAMVLGLRKGEAAHGITGEAQPAEQANGQEVVGYVNPIEWGNRESERVVKVTRFPHPNYGFTSPVVTTPPAQPAREWVGLTEFEIASAMTGQPEVGISFQALCSIARAIESASREKNAGLPATIKLISSYKADLDASKRDALDDARRFLADTGIDAGGDEVVARVVGGNKPGATPWVRWQCIPYPKDGTLLYTRPQPQTAVPDGYVLVPVEPTDDMLTAAVYAIAGGTARMVALEHYRAMLAAAPKPRDDLPAILKKQAS